ncbi:MAG: polyprenol monophosphomannose synthase [Oligoflexia bacterium]|nr:polyprenol monophosphomannose synthase [Oligoflexia bacterium]
MKKLIVIPTFNERDNIAELVKVIFILHSDVNILVVDDGSPDGTADVVKNMQKQYTNLHLLQRAGKQGLGKAYIAGFKWALVHDFDFIVEMDADWSHPPRYLKTMFELGLKNDFVIGSRYVSGGGAVNWSFFRQLISKFGSLYARLILRVKINDFTGGFNGWNKNVLQALDLDSISSDGYSFQIEIKYKAAMLGFKYIEFPILFEERREGQSKMSSAIVREAMVKVWKIRQNKQLLQSPASK